MDNTTVNQTAKSATDRGGLIKVWLLLHLEIQCDTGDIKLHSLKKKSTPTFRKLNISYLLIRRRTCTYQGVRNVYFFRKFDVFIFLIPPFLRLAFLHYCRQVEYFKTFPFNPFLSKHVDIFFPKSFILDPFQTILVHGSRTKYLSNIPFCRNDRNDFDLPVQFNVSGKNSFDFKFSISRTIF